MSETNFIGTEWRNNRTKHVYTVIDQTNRDKATPSIAGDALVVLESFPKSESQQYITLTTRLLEKEFTPHGRVQVGTPGVEPVSKP